MTTDKSKIINQVLKNISKGYEIPEDFEPELKKLLLEVLAPYYIYNTPPGGKKKGKKAKDPDHVPKAGAYTQFVKAKMPEFKELPIKERMGEIGKLWKELDADGRKEYVDLANKINEENQAAKEKAT